ncbi:C40 family peptidase [Lacihabitans lacunae]|uniref:NlpC/P60 family protein n=1 Tax=Lacihabitans lacunae TaxID=1028214 RepID=A0ABV7YTU5_9BACT
MKSKILISFSLLLLIRISVFSQSQNILYKVKSEFAPDSRTAIFEIKYDSVSGTLKGKTNIIKAKEKLIFEFSKASVNLIDSVETLPNKTLSDNRFGIVNVSVANLRTTPNESAELASQLLLGMPLRLLEKHRGWYRVQSPDQYIGWVDGSTIEVFTQKAFENQTSIPKVVYVQTSGFALSDSLNSNSRIRDLSFGNLNSYKKVGANYTELILPDGKLGFVKNADVVDSKLWLKNLNSDITNIKEITNTFLGIPYLWGGTSYKGVDCSGFTRMAYFSKGLLLPRDASQQVLLGKEISIENNFKNLQEGDLLFFGNTTTKKVTHVAIWLGDLKFVHSSGMVKINSFDKNDPDFDSYNLERLIVVKRLSENLPKLGCNNLYILD